MDTEYGIDLRHVWVNNGILLMPPSLLKIYIIIIMIRVFILTGEFVKWKWKVLYHGLFWVLYLHLFWDTIRGCCNKLDLAFNNVKPNDWYFVLDLVRVRTELGCVRLTNQIFWLDGSRASFLVPGYSPSKSYGWLIKFFLNM